LSRTDIHDTILEALEPEDAAVLEDVLQNTTMKEFLTAMATVQTQMVEEERRQSGGLPVVHEETACEEDDDDDDNDDDLPAIIIQEDKDDDEKIVKLRKGLERY
jgi:hypothetical protein